MAILLYEKKHPKKREYSILVWTHFKGQIFLSINPKYRWVIQQLLTQGDDIGKPPNYKMGFHRTRVKTLWQARVCTWEIKSINKKLLRYSVIRKCDSLRNLSQSTSRYANINRKTLEHLLSYYHRWDKISVHKVFSFTSNIISH